MTVAPGATLGGSGQLPSLTLNGTVAPGNSPGMLTVNGNLALGPGSLYLAEIQGPLADWITVTGTASLAGTRRLVPLGGAYLFSTPYTLLSAAGGLGGTTFGTVNTTDSFSDGITSSIAYTGTEVLLTLAPKQLLPIVTPSLGVSAPRNAASVASGTTRRSLPGPIPPCCLQSTTSRLPRSLRREPALWRGPHRRTRHGQQRGWPAPACPRNRTGRAAPPSTPRFSIWGATFGSTGRNDGDRSAGSANRNLSNRHVAVGADIRLGSNTVAGVAVAGGQSRASLSGGLGKAEADVFQAGLYGRATLGTVDLAAAPGYARLETDTSRAIPALARTGVAASYATQAWSGRTEASLPVETWHGLTLSPLAAFQAVRASSPAAIERDGVGATRACRRWQDAPT